MVPMDHYLRITEDEKCMVTIIDSLCIHVYLCIQYCHLWHELCYLTRLEHQLALSHRMLFEVVKCRYMCMNRRRVVDLQRYTDTLLNYLILGS